METKINWMICLLAGLLFGACSGNRPVQIQGVLRLTLIYFRIIRV